jgi:hypothetical protein
MASTDVKRSTPGLQPNRPRPHSSPGADSEKLRAYHTLYRLNRAFELVRLNLNRLKELGFRHLFLEEFLSLAEELRAETNFKLIMALSEREQEDWVQFGVLTREREKRLRDPYDVLVEADQIGQQQKRKRTLARKHKRA